MSYHAGNRGKLEGRRDNRTKKGGGRKFNGKKRK
jgi:hypothetical protein